MHEFNKLGMTPLHWAIKRGNLEIATVLVDYDADVTIKDSMNRSCYDLAEESRN